MLLSPDWHPNLPIMAVSIHPCRHGKVMKRLSDQLHEGGAVGTDRYLILFLKFVASIVPTIEYDFTIEAGK